jgi:3-dehydroquinate synthetase
MNLIKIFHHFDRYPVAVAYAIKRCCMIKAEILQEDRRANLTLGQPFGHVLHNTHL